VTRFISFTCFAVLTSLGVAFAATPPAHARSREEIHVLGRVNVNEATEAQLASVPGLSKAAIARILRARSERPIVSVSSLRVGGAAARYLATSGPTDLLRIRKLPLEKVAAPPQEDDAPEQARAAQH
jgi:hypothetical protein